MHVAKEHVDIKMQIPGAVIRQHKDFGDASGLGKISCEYFTCLPASTPRHCFRVWRATCANHRIGAMCWPVR
jgi:hypothetical protein